MIMLSKECPYCGKKYPNKIATKKHKNFCKYIPQEDENKVIEIIKNGKDDPDIVKISNPYGKDFLRLQDDDLSHDVTMVSRDGTLVTCHAAVLAASSTFFEDLLEEPCSKDNSALIVAQNIDGGQMKNLIDFLYVGKMSISKEEVNNMKALLDQFQIKVITEDILEIFKENYTVEQSGYNADENEKDCVITKQMPKNFKEITEDIEVVTKDDIFENYALKHSGDNADENDKDYLTTKIKLKKIKQIKGKTSRNRSRQKREYYEKMKKLKNVPVTNKMKSVCDYCGFESTSLKYTMKHIKKDHPDFFDAFAKIHIQTPCQYCDEKFLNKVQLYLHKKEWHPESLPIAKRLLYNINDGLPNVTKRQCPHCPKVLSNLNCYKDHIQKHLTGKKQPFECENCEKKFSKSCRFKVHRKKHEISINPILCNLCGSTFQSEFDYDKHNKEHSLEIPKKKTFLPKPVDPHFSAKCSVCGKDFTTENAYGYHIKNAHVEQDKLLKCPHCLQTFTVPSSLEHHIKLHLPPTLDCNHCAKKFHTNHYLRRHIKSQHVDNRWKDFICSQCGKGFSQKSNYKGHLNMHAGLKPFKCRYCEMCYQNSSNRIAHEKSRHPNLYIRRVNCPKGIRIDKR